MRVTPLILSSVLLIMPASAAVDSAAARRAPMRGVALQQVASGLDSVTSIVNAGDSREFFTTQDGRIWILRDGAVVDPPFLDLSSLTQEDGERGLLSVAFHPDYSHNGRLFVDYTNLQGDTVIARYSVLASNPDQADLGSAAILLTIAQPYANHNGGELQFGPDGMLYVGMGDGGAGGDPECRAQNGAELLGKLLRLDVDRHADSAPFHAVPLDNPYPNGGPMPPLAWAKGLRNPWRFSFDRRTGDLWIGDVGQDSREEIDFEPAGSHGGRNYGWNVMEGTACYDGPSCPPATPPCGSRGYTGPVLQYAHGRSEVNCAVVGGYVYRGSAVPAIAGTYLYGDLCSGTLWSASRARRGWIARTLAIRLPGLQTFGESAAGELYVGTGGGEIYRFVRARR